MVYYGKKKVRNNMSVISFEVTDLYQFIKDLQAYMSDDQIIEILNKDYVEDVDDQIYELINDYSENFSDNFINKLIDIDIKYKSIDDIFFVILDDPTCKYSTYVFDLLNNTEKYKDIIFFNAENILKQLNNFIWFNAYKHINNYYNTQIGTSYEVRFDELDQYLYFDDIEIDSNCPLNKDFIYTLCEAVGYEQVKEYRGNDWTLDVQQYIEEQEAFENGEY